MEDITKFIVLVMLWFLKGIIAAVFYVVFIGIFVGMFKLALRGGLMLARSIDEWREGVIEGEFSAQEPR